jgi:PAS domain S-box-containing protein
MLQAALQKRKESNPRYSLRAFASFLGLHPSALSRILNGKQDLSVPSALQILRKLKLSPEDQEAFIVSVGEEKSRQTFATLNTAKDVSQLETALREREELLVSIRREKDAEARSSQKLLETVIATLPVAFCVIDHNGGILLQNSLLAKYLPSGKIPSLSESESPHWIAYHEDGTRLQRHEFPGARALRGESVMPGLEILYKPADAPPVWTKVAAVPMRDEAGKITGAVVAISDIDAEKRYQEALMASAEHLRTVANIIPDLIWNSQPDGTRTWFNARWMEYTGQSYEEALGMGYVAAIHPDDREALAKDFREAVLLRQRFESEHRIRKSTGEYRWFYVRAAPELDAKGEIIRMYGAATDVHDLLKEHSKR